MAVEKKDDLGAKEDWLKYLRTIIHTTLKRISEDKKRILTIQEVSKLIDVHEKLADNRAGTREFWDMLARIRKDELAAKKEGTAAPRPGKSPSRRRTAPKAERGKS